MRADIQEAATQWLTSKRATRDSQVIAKIVARVEHNLETFGGYVSPAHFERAYLELRNEREIPEFRGSMAEKVEAESTPIPPEVIRYIETTSAFEQQRRYKTDSTFRSYYDRYEKEKEESVLTPEIYNRMPARELQVKLRDPKFKLRIMQMIKAGQI